MLAALLACIVVYPAIAFRSSMQEPVDSADTSARWLLSYKRDGEGLEFLEKNTRLRALLEAGLPHYGVPWYRSSQSNWTLPDGVLYAISVLPGSVTVKDNRFVTITGTAPREGDLGGLLWCDTAAEQPTLIFVFIEKGLGKAEGSARLNIYRNGDHTDSPLPRQLVDSVHAWLKGLKIGTLKEATVHDARDQTAPLSTSDLSPQ